MKLFLCYLCRLSQKSNTTTTSISKSKTAEQNHGNLHIFSYKELTLATNNFSSSNKIGEGGFGSVYKGRLQDGSLVAVKVVSIDAESTRGERQFVSELAALSNIRHNNLVTLQGCCVDGAKRYLVYEYMQNNSLAHMLLVGGEKGRKNFSWEARRKICLGIARGIAYLHEEVQPHIVHRDIKASNILLDKNFTPKLGDFGLSRVLKDGSSFVSTHVAGTLGHVAPEYAISGRLTRRSDVYSFGVLLLEIVSGRSAVDFDLELGEHYLVQKAWEESKANNLRNLVDPTLNINFPEEEEEEAVRFLKVGLLCVQEAAKLRPRMSIAFKMLTKEIDLREFTISQPGLVSDFMDIKLRQRSSSQTTSSGGSSSTTSVLATKEF